MLGNVLSCTCCTSVSPVAGPPAELVVRAEGRGPIASEVHTWDVESQERRQIPNFAKTTIIFFEFETEEVG